MQYENVYNFWFQELSPDKRFAKDPEIDELIDKRFHELHHAASSNELYDWRSSPRSALSEIIILDQFSRNLFRDSLKSFASDSQALSLAQFAIKNDHDKDLSTDEKAFLYMPFMHSESKLIHEIALQLYSQEGLGAYLQYEIAHKKIIDRFGRYPHRNIILKRNSTQEEIDFLKGPNSSF